MKDIVKRLREALWAAEGRNQSPSYEKSSGKNRQRVTCTHPPCDGAEPMIRSPQTTAETGRYDERNGCNHRGHYNNRQKRPIHIDDRREQR
ncbi:hypothetical protein GCM10009712_32050 [Pseudarthrobacter sulfonivorans]